MKLLQSQPPTRSPLPWLIVVLAGIAAPALAIVLLGLAPDAAPLVQVAGPVLAVGLMAVGMIGAAAAGRLWTGIALALVTGGGLVLLARLLGMPALSHPVAAGLGMVIASLSFAARGALFARSAADKGWWIAVFVVAGEAAMLSVASAMPGALPHWLLSLLPAQWASAVIGTALAGEGALAAGSELLALAGTAAATLLVARLWPHRWPYLVMFTTWLCLSALVFHRPALPVPHAAPAVSAERGSGSLAGRTAA